MNKDVWELIVTWIVLAIIGFAVHFGYTNYKQYKTKLLKGVDNTCTVAVEKEGCCITRSGVIACSNIDG